MSKKNDLVIFDSKLQPGYGSVYEYKALENGAELIYSSLQETWTYPNETAAKLIDTGDDLIFIDPISNKTITLNYCQAQLLRGLLHLTDTEGSTIERLKRK